MRITANEELRCSTSARCRTSVRKAHTPLDPDLIEGTLREEKIRQSDTLLDPILVEGTLREEFLSPLY